MSLEENVNENVKPEISAEKKEENGNGENREEGAKPARRPQYRRPRRGQRAPKAVKVEEKEGTDNIISLFYKKNKINYSPLVITNINYSDTTESTRLQTISISLKQISLSIFNDESYETTNILTKNNTYTICESMDLDLPKNLYEEMKQKHPEFQEITNEIENFFDFNTK